MVPLLVVFVVLSTSLPAKLAIAQEAFQLNNSRETIFWHLHRVLREVLYAATVKDTRCVVIITDDQYWRLYNQNFFDAAKQFRSIYIVRLKKFIQDPFATKQRHKLPFKKIRAAQCGLHFITIADVDQVKRLLIYADKKRYLSAADGKFVFLHDVNLLQNDMWPIWCNMLNSIFLQQREDNSFTIYGIAFPNILDGGLVITRILFQWRFNSTGASRVEGGDGTIQFFTNEKVFPVTHTDNLRGITVRVAVYEHVPMVMSTPIVVDTNHEKPLIAENIPRNSNNNTRTKSKADNQSTSNDVKKQFFGLEIEIIRTLAHWLNFTPIFYEPEDSATERWGRDLNNGSYTGLIAELDKRKAEFAIGDLHFYALYTKALDLSWPHTYECLTFLTPESSRDNSWRTLIQPFSNGMWAGVLLSHLLVGSVFYVFSYVNAIVQSADTEHFFCWWRRYRRQKKAIINPTMNEPIFRDARFRAYVYRLPVRWQRDGGQRPDLFDDYSHCLLLAYSMLMYVSLPRMPRHSALRVLTGWFWIYCILVTATYRASLTAILANPAARITIDTLTQLERSGITVGTGSVEHKRLFDEARDELARHVGQRMQIVDDMENVAHRIAKEWHAYYDNKYFLRKLRLRDNSQVLTGDKVLHIMNDCIVRMPVGVGMVRNSPLKPVVDRLLLRLMEAGLLAKWLKDATKELNEPEQSPPEAVMNLRKIWSSFVALALGLFAAGCAIAFEHWHYRYIVRSHPLFDKYNRNLYYNYQQRWPAHLKWNPIVNVHSDIKQKHQILLRE